jgi:pyrrolidone-carboxylate peptidase
MVGVIQRLGDRYRMRSVQLPVDFVKLREIVPGLARSSARALLLAGEAPFDTVKVEQVALNIAHSDSPDNARHKPQVEPLVVDGPLALRAPWNAVAFARRLSQGGIPATASFHARTYALKS